MYNPPLQGAAHEQPEIGQAMTAADGNQAKMADAGNTTDTSGDSSSSSSNTVAVAVGAGAAAGVVALAAIVVGATVLVRRRKQRKAEKEGYVVDTLGIFNFHAYTTRRSQPLPPARDVLHAQLRECPDPASFRASQLMIVCIAPD